MILVIVVNALVVALAAVEALVLVSLVSVAVVQRMGAGVQAALLAGAVGLGMKLGIGARVGVGAGKHL